MLPWRKLTVDFTGVDWFQFRGPRTQCFGGTFHEFGLANPQQFWQQVRARVVFPIPPDLALFTDVTHPGVGIHRDQYPTVVNYYITADQDRTDFYQTPTDFQWTGVRTYEAQDLVKQSEFTAAQGDVYLLDVSCLHRVSAAQRTRQLLRFVWKHRTFREIAQSLEQI